MFCKNCGKEIKEDSEYCLYCGAKVNENIQHEQNNKKSNKSLILVLAVIILCTIVIALTIILLLPKNKKDENNSNTLSSKEQQSETEITSSKEQQSETEITSSKEQQSDSEITSSKEQQSDSDTYSLYQGLLAEMAGEIGYQCVYSVYDMNKDGVNELIAKIGENEAEYEYFIYSIIQGSVNEIGKCSASHSTLYANEEGTGVIVAEGIQGYEKVTLLKYTGTDIEESIIKEGDIGNADYYSNDSPLSVCYFTDYYLLEPKAELIGRTLDESTYMEETHNGVQEEAESNTKQLNFLPISMNIIGTDFQLLCKKTNNYITEVAPAQYNSIPITLKEGQTMYKEISYVPAYYIVENNTVVGCAQYNGNAPKMKQNFPTDDCYNIQPSIIWSDSYGYCCWQTDNSLLVFGGISSKAYEDRYYDWPTTISIVLKYPEQFSLYSQIQ